MNSSYQNTIPRYKQCAGKGCNREGLRPLKIRFLNKTGWFCENCKSDLIKHNLADPSRTDHELNGT
jgi:hypothetical protein